MTMKTHHAEIPFRWRPPTPRPPVAEERPPLPEGGAAADSAGSHLHLARAMRPEEVPHA
jgi:hypothetical protein